MRKFYTSFLVGCLSFLSVYGQDCDGQYTNDITDSATVTTVEFGSAVNSLGETQILEMDIYQPYNVSTENRPVIIIAFGGSFVGGNKRLEDMIYFSYEFAKKGYVCAAIDYRLAQITDLVFEENMVKEVFRAVQDGKAAIRFFRQDAANENTYKIDPDKIFIGGTSAGGILAVNLAYMDDENKLSEEWQGWLEEVGGLEGESGNPGFCSKPNGVFSFSGAAADTSWIEANDVPIYSAHSTEDGTVPYRTGRPLNGVAPISVQGSGDVHDRMNNLGVYNVLDTYYDGAHPSFSSNNPDTNAVRIQEIEDHLTQFLYDIMYCNPENKLQDGVEACLPRNVDELAQANQLIVYPNPAGDKFKIKGRSGIYTVYNVLGKEQMRLDVFGAEQEIDASGLSRGTYYIRGNTGETKTLIIR